jgi:hypothetical protein
MVLKQEELLSRYFEHRMSADEEQNFLIQLAASNELRTAFRSHLELQKAIRDDKDDLRAVAQVRTRTLTALGLSASAVTPFIEQELMRNKPVSDETAITASLAPSHSLVSRLGLLVRNRSIILSAGLLIGFASATAIFGPETSRSSRIETSLPNSPVTSNPVFTVQPSPADIQPETGGSISGRETIHSSKDLNTMPHPATSSSSPTDQVAGNTYVHGAPGHHTSRTAATVTVSKPGGLHVNPAKVTKTPDSTTKE